MDNGVTENGRIDAVDALRGFAISAILIIHSSNHFLYPGMPDRSPEWLLHVDEGLKSFLYFIFEGKAYSVFALLFGFTYALQLDKRLAEGKDMKYRMVWRMFLLALFGFLNAAFFAGGDPLIFYALCMIPVICLRHARNKVLFGVGLFFSGTFVEMLKANVTDGVKGCLLWALQTGRLSQTLGLFCIGMLAYRTGCFRRNVSFYKRLTVSFLVLSAWLYILLMVVGNTPLRLYYNLSFSACLVNLLLWGYYKSQTVSAWKFMKVYGRMSLTNFIGQSLICTFLFYPWGLHWGIFAGTSISVALSIVVWIVQVLFSFAWFRYHKQGPLEYLWHKWTWIGRKDF